MYGASRRDDLDNEFYFSSGVILCANSFPRRKSCQFDFQVQVELFTVKISNSNISERARTYTPTTYNYPISTLQLPTS